jgi:hypothetical protein
MSRSLVPGWDDYMGGNMNSICIPISAGTYWSYYTWSPDVNQANANIQIWWFPMGSNSSGDTFRFVKEGEFEVPSPPKLPQITKREAIVEKRKKAANEFISELEKVFGVSTDKKSKISLIESLLNL